MLNSWNGKSVQKKTVSLGGRSKEKTAAELLVEAKWERMRRARENKENKAATSIQAAWRGRSARSQLNAKLKREWAEYSTSEITLSASEARIFLAAYAGRLRDAKELEGFCRRLQSNELIRGGSQTDMILFHRAKTLVAFCLDAICLDADQAQAQSLVMDFSQPMSSGTSAGVLCATILSFTDLFPGILRQLVSLGLIEKLRCLLMTIEQRSEANQSVSLAESFSTRMIVMCFSTGALSAASSLIQLLTVPHLFSRAPSLWPLSKPIIRNVGAAVSEAANNGAINDNWISTKMPRQSRGAILHNLISSSAAASSFLLPLNDLQSLTAVSGIAILLQILLHSTKQSKEDDMQVDDEVNIPKTLWEERKLISVLISALLPLPSEEHFALVCESKINGSDSICLLISSLVSSRSEKLLRLPFLSHTLALVPRLWFGLLKNANFSTPDHFDPFKVTTLCLFAQTFLQYITFAELKDFFVDERPLAQSELPVCILLMRDFLSNSLWSSFPQPPSAGPLGLIMFNSDGLLEQALEAVSLLFKKLFERNCLQTFVSDITFHSTAIPSERFFALAVSALSKDSDLLMDEGRSSSSPDDHVKALRVLMVCPCLVPFHTRARIFSSVVEGERITHNEAQNAAQMIRLERAWTMEQAAMDLDEEGDEGRTALRNQMNGLAPTFIPIRRGSVLDDGFKSLGGAKGVAKDLKSRVRVQFFDENGDAEAGIDGGGLFKDFIEGCLVEGFTNPRFFSSNSDNEIYPNPILPSEPAKREEHLAMLGFMGKMTGKAVWEGILINSRFAQFFLKHLAQARCDVNDLASLDRDVARNLLHLRSLSPDQFEDLGLYFTTNEGRELITGGKTMPVTHSNTSEYILRLSNYLLHGQTELPFRAFLSGFYSIIKPSLTLMFLPSELQLLLGGSESELDLDDLRRAVTYEGGYYEAHPTIQTFWAAVTTFSDKERKSLIKFITSCSRAPLLGFTSLQPKICIVMSGGMLDSRSIERLPTAATCMNLLKLPPYPTVGMMRDKLLLAITSGAGFDLS